MAPPNQVVWRSCFEGVDADLVVVWKHNLFSHNVILKEQIVLPEGMSEKSSVLEVLTEIVEAPEPMLNEQVVKQDGRPDIEDDVTITFGSMLFLRGQAFLAAEDKSLILGSARLDETHAVPVLKRFTKTDDG